MALLPNREAATVQAWLCGHPGIKIVSRDRGGGYGEAVTKAIPDAIQVADRWHLMENASAAFLDAARRSMRGIRTAIGATTINPVLLTSADRLRHQDYLLRREAYGTIAALVSNNVPLKEIARRRTGRSRNFVPQISRGAGTDVFRSRQSTLDIHLPFLETQWTGGCHNGAELWRRLKGQGFEGSLSVVTGWATRRRRAEQASDQQLRKVPAARSIARLMTARRDHLTTAETVTVAAIEQGVPMSAKARALVDRFQAMIRKKAEIELEPWINESKQSLIASFATGIAKDKAAVHAAIIQPWSNGQVEAQITKLKLVKRQMYGRASSIYFRPGLLVRHDLWRYHRNCVRPKVQSVFTAHRKMRSVSHEIGHATFRSCLDAFCEIGGLAQPALFVEFMIGRRLDAIGESDTHGCAGRNQSEG